MENPYLVEFVSKSGTHESTTVYAADARGARQKVADSIGIRWIVRIARLM